MKEIFEKIVAGKAYKIILSKTKNNSCQYKKIEVLEKNEGYQIAKYTDKQVFHENVKVGELSGRLTELVEDFRQVNAWSADREYQVLISKKGEASFKEKKVVKDAPKMEVSHNRQKNYILPEGEVIPPLVDMGIFTKDGKIVNSMQDKYRQINRFIELIDDVIKKSDYTELNVIDFGCGKSYLTFILYYYLTKVRGIKVHMVGLDLKEDVIKKCNVAAKKYGYDGLEFKLGNINGFKPDFDVDMVITLHACDTATDYAMYNAISWNTKMIFSVPCCQHEINNQLKKRSDDILTRYGIISERFSALLTDSIRANLLEYMGYRTQLVEFVDLDNTPKNILVRAIKAKNMSAETKAKALDEVENTLNQYQISQTLHDLVKKMVEK